MSKTIGDLTPLHRAMEELDERIEAAARDRAADDHGLLAMRSVRRLFSDALDDAVRPIEGLTVDEYAEQEGITRFGAYKRIARGQVQAERRGGRLLIQSAA